MQLEDTRYPPGYVNFPNANLRYQFTQKELDKYGEMAKLVLRANEFFLEWGNASSLDKKRILSQKKKDLDSMTIDFKRMLRSNRDIKLIELKNDFSHMHDPTCINPVCKHKASIGMILEMTDRLIDFINSRDDSFPEDAEPPLQFAIRNVYEIVHVFNLEQYREKLMQAAVSPETSSKTKNSTVDANNDPNVFFVSSVGDYFFNLI